MCFQARQSLSATAFAADVNQAGVDGPNWRQRCHLIGSSRRQLNAVNAKCLEIKRRGETQKRPAVSSAVGDQIACGPHFARV